MDYKTEFIKNLSEGDKKLLDQVVHASGLLEQMDKAKQRYTNGPDTWPEDNNFYCALTNAIETEAMAQIICIKEKGIEEQKKDIDLVTHYTISVSAAQYTKIKTKSKEYAIPITRLMNILVDNYLDRISIKINCT